MDPWSPTPRTARSCGRSSPATWSSGGAGSNRDRRNSALSCEFALPRQLPVGSQGFTRWRTRRGQRYRLRARRFQDVAEGLAPRERSMRMRFAVAVGVVGFSLAAGSANVALAAGTGDEAKVSPWLEQRLAGGGESEFLVLMDENGRPSVDATISRDDLYRRLTATARGSQKALLADLAARGVSTHAFYIVNAVLVRGNADLVRSLAARPEVSRIVGNPRIATVLPEKTVDTQSLVPEVEQYNIAMIKASQVWSTYGTTGQGIVVASADTGVDWAHPDLQLQYRGFDAPSGEADHSYAWHDTTGLWAIPYDDNSHGTHTTGILAGTDGHGVAPGATWIACKNMDHGAGTPATYIECMEWTLAPY